MTRSPELRCPWCSHSAEDRDDLRVHLMVEHRKSELAAFVIERVVDREAPEQAEPAPA